MSGYRGVFFTEENKSFAADNYNYSRQLGGGADAPNDPLYPGEGISIVDKTILNGRYPIGQHQSYLNTSDGLSYSIMLKGEDGLKQGTFVTFSKDPCKEKLLIKAHRGDNIVGVITKTSGFIANAGQFPASERIEYDKYHNPLVFNNCVPNATSDLSSLKKSVKIAPSEHIPAKINAGEEVKNTCPEGQHLAFPAFQTVPRQDINREVPFVPYTQRDNYYQVGLLGLVVVRVDPRSQLFNMCDVECGKAVEGNKYWVLERIDCRHALILLK